MAQQQGGRRPDPKRNQKRAAGGQRRSAQSTSARGTGYVPQQGYQNPGYSGRQTPNAGYSNPGYSGQQIPNAGYPNPGYGNQQIPNPGYAAQTDPNGAAKSRAAAQKKARARRKQELLRRRKRQRRTWMGLGLLLVIAVLFVAIKTFNGTLGEPTDDGLDILDSEELDDEAEEALYDGPPVAKIAFVGDISTSADQVAAVTKADGTYDFSVPFADLTAYFSTDQVAYAVGNFETTLVDDLSYGGEPYYNSPVQLAGALRTLGLRLVSTANTYALNNGIEGLTSTKNYLTEARLRSVGTYLSQQERDENGGAYIRTIHKIKFAFLAYTKGTDSVTMPEGCEYALNTLYSDYSDYWSDLNSSQIRADVQAAKEAGAEVIIALVHWGSEYTRSVSEGQREVTDLLLENGVDVIIGTHSHVVNEMGFQEVELSDGTTKECFVAYGLGDFYTDPEQEEGQQSLILNLEFSRGDSGQVTITEASYVPLYQYITETDGKRQFQVLDVYKNLAELKRTEELTSVQAQLFNSLLETIESLHNYAGEELDAGPADADRRIVEKALEEGPISDSTIRDLQEAEQEAAEESARASAEAAGEEYEEPASSAEEPGT